MKNATKMLYGLACVCYVGLLVYFLFFAEGFREQTEYHYNIVPFREISRYLTYYETIGVSMVFLNLVGNIVAFMPFGFFVPMFGRRQLSFWTVTLFTAEFSALVEVIQLFTRVGSCDIDDVILNTLGGMLGYGMFLLRKRGIAESDGEKTIKEEERHEP